MFTIVYRLMKLSFRAATIQTHATCLFLPCEKQRSYTAVQCAVCLIPLCLDGYLPSIQLSQASHPTLTLLSSSSTNKMSSELARLWMATKHAKANKATQDEVDIIVQAAGDPVLWAHVSGYNTHENSSLLLTCC